MPCPPGQYPSSGYGTVLGNTLNNTSPDWGVGVNLQIPLRNRIAQADQVRSQMEYRQSQMRLQQLYTQIRIQVINGVYALTNDRAAVQSVAVGARLCGAGAGGRAEEVQAWCFDDSERAADGAQPGDVRGQYDLGDGGVCA